MTKTKPMTEDRLTSLLERKGELCTIIELETLRRAAETLDGGTYDPKPLKAAQDELEAIEDAEQEHTRRARSAAADVAAAGRRKKAGEAIEVLAAWVAGIEEQELAARSLVDAGKRTEVACHTLRGLLRDVTGSVPIQLSACEQEDRRSRGLSALLGDYKRSNPGSGNTGAFGEITLRAGLFKASDSWSDVERDLALDLEQQLKEILK